MLDACVGTYLKTVGTIQYKYLLPIPIQFIGKYNNQGNIKLAIIVIQFTLNTLLNIFKLFGPMIGTYLYYLNII